MSKEINKTINLIVIGVVIILLAVGLSGCTSNPPSNTPNDGNNDDSDPVTNQDDIDRQRFIGTWLRDDGRTEIRYADGSKEIDGEFYGYWTELTPRENM